MPIKANLYGHSIRWTLNFFSFQRSAKFINSKEKLNFSSNQGFTPENITNLIKDVKIVKSHQSLFVRLGFMAYQLLEFI